MKNKKINFCVYFSLAIFLLVIILAISEIFYKVKSNAYGIILIDGHIYQFRNMPSMLKSQPNIFHDENRCEKCKINKMATCQKCGSIRIIGNVPRDRGVITAFKCLDCGYTWKVK